MKKKTKTVKKGRYIKFGDEGYKGRIEGDEFVVYYFEPGGKPEEDCRFSKGDAAVARAVARAARSAFIYAGIRRIHSVTPTSISVGCTDLTHAQVEQVARLLEEAA